MTTYLDMGPHPLNTALFWHAGNVLGHCGAEDLQ